jgi:hypothetical protein
MGLELMMTNETSSVASESLVENELPSISPVKSSPFTVWFGAMLVMAMMKTHKGYRKTRTSRYRNGDIQRQRKGKKK